MLETMLSGEDITMPVEEHEARRLAAQEAGFRGGLIRILIFTLPIFALMVIVTNQLIRMASK